MRFDKLISDILGISRKESRLLIKKGVCAADGQVISDPSAQISENSVITAGGKEYLYKKYIYLMMNKPAGVISASDDKRQKTVIDLLPENYRRYNLFPAGRLDIDTEGFLLITNDGQTAHNLLSPSKKVGKTYFARLASPLSESDAEKLCQGVDIGGYVTRPASLERLSPLEWNITISEGKFHQVKKMFETVNNRVLYLKRVTFASLSLDPSLPPGSFRPLTDDEIDIITKPR